MGTRRHAVRQRGFVSHVFLMVLLILTGLILMGAIAVPVAGWLHVGFPGALGLIVGGLAVSVLLLRLKRIVHWVLEKRRRLRR